MPTQFKLTFQLIHMRLCHPFAIRCGILLNIIHNLKLSSLHSSECEYIIVYYTYIRICSDLEAYFGLHFIATIIYSLYFFSCICNILYIIIKRKCVEVQSSLTDKLEILLLENDSVIKSKLFIVELLLQFE
ncbi:LOW QUALITY PROTEIN: Protein of unknown function [Gryllus bimaculatus]|nr:LOW QUALITY PROTEIN: Protein of unknown function [Gryllus bimaculatus]